MERNRGLVFLSSFSLSSSLSAWIPGHLFPALHTRIQNHDSRGASAPQGPSQTPELRSIESPSVQTSTYSPPWAIRGPGGHAGLVLFVCCCLFQVGRSGKGQPWLQAQKRVRACCPLKTFSAIYLWELSVQPLLPDFKPSPVHLWFHLCSLSCLSFPKRDLTYFFSRHLETSM